MDFWGVEVLGGRPLKDSPGDGTILHLTGAAIPMVKEERVSVQLRVKPKDKEEIVIATLFSDKLPQQKFKLVLDTEFTLSHNWKAGSVFFYGYTANNPFAESNEDQCGKRKVKTVNEPYDASEESEDVADTDEDVESEDEETPKKGQSGKKEAAESATKTPDKKATVTPQKTDGKRGVHCGSCNRRFGKLAAVESHTKDKHSAGK